ncbi:MAG TPA: class II aldolase/adducin family protein [Acidimicrobiia bacterium]|jgi:ribulose-5-phosphate 4-epimerase/fuculose-1-phosphate aldolase|nr:class II aldolase/adducin family protein [Acidimicrobiia bacterium]
MQQSRTGAVALADRRGVTDRTFARHGRPTTPTLAWMLDGLTRALAASGYEPRDAPGPDTQVVLHALDLAHPRPYRRKRAPTFVVALAALPERPDDLLRTGYPLLVRGLANLAVLVSDEGRPAAHFVTLEQGTATIEHDGNDDAFFEAVFARLEPMASSRLVIGNDFRPDLPVELWAGDEQTAQIARAGQRLAELDLLPAPFPIEELLSERDLRHVKLLYGIGGLSYGNLSARRQPRADRGLGPEFWMSASGVDKGHLREVGREVLLVRGYDPDADAMVLAVPPHVTPNRVSVDAIEHWMIYREHPAVGAIVHVHAWIDGTPATEISYPCGTIELAGAVADIVRRAPDPSRAVVGQRNHGLTITGRDLDEIFERTEGRIVRQVPMD